MIDPNRYTFPLPPELVAQEPSPERGGTRLLVVDRHGSVEGVRPFSDLPDLLRAGDVLVCNDSRVLPARLWARRADTGGKVEVLLTRPHDLATGSWLAMARPARRLRAGVRLQITAPGEDEPLGPELEVLGRTDAGWIQVQPLDGHRCEQLAEKHGDIPLPPYIRRDPSAAEAGAQRESDRRRYQTVYARPTDDGAGSVAAPTAGLHFTDALLADLQDRGIQMARVTLHVGPGTFLSPTEEQVASRRLHAEHFILSAETQGALRRCREAGGRIITVGTTSLRVLETVARLDLDHEAPVGTSRQFPEVETAVPEFEGLATRTEQGWEVAGTTRLFIQPPDQVTAADGMVTNFHLPGSSLLMLVAAFAGDQVWRDAYQTAVNHPLYFFSYGDAMLVRPVSEESS